MNTTSAPVEVVPAGAPDRLQSAAARRLQRRSRAVWVSCALVVIIVVAAALATELVLSALGRPALLVALIVGIVVGIGQTLTQMHEPVIGLVPRVLAVLLVVLVALPWLISVWVDFARTMIDGIPDLLTVWDASISPLLGWI